MEAAAPALCCPRFDPKPWSGKTITWDDRPFVRDRVRSFLHIPLNFGSVVKRNMQLIEAAGAVNSSNVILCDENSLWGADVYIAVTRPVDGAYNMTLSGDFICNVFKGEYRMVPKWMNQMRQALGDRGILPQRFLVYYTTCPRCAKVYGANYVVLLAQVD
jgi:hypothetical protein